MPPMFFEIVYVLILLIGILVVLKSHQLTKPYKYLWVILVLLFNRECNLNSVWFLFLLNHNKYNFFFLDLQMLLKVVFGCVQGRRRMSRLYTLAHIRELPFLCV